MNLDPTSEKFNPRIVDVKHIGVAGMLNGNMLSAEPNESDELMKTKGECNFDMRPQSDPDIKLEYSIATVFGDETKDANTDLKQKYISLENRLEKNGNKTVFYDSCIEAEQVHDSKQPDSSAIRYCIVALEKLPASLVKNKMVNKRKERKLLSTNNSKINAGGVNNTQKYITWEKSVLHEQLSEKQKMNLMNGAVKSRSFVRPAREYSQKWGFLISEHTVHELFADYISELPLKEISSEMLVLKKCGLRMPENVSAAERSVLQWCDELTPEEKLKLFDSFEYPTGNEAAQFVYENFGKFISCDTARTFFKDNYRRSSVKVSVEDQIGMVNMAVKKGLRQTASFYTQKLPHLHNRISTVKLFCKIAGVTAKD